MSKLDDLYVEKADLEDEIEELKNDDNEAAELERTRAMRELAEVKEDIRYLIDQGYDDDDEEDED